MFLYPFIPKGCSYVTNLFSVNDKTQDSDNLSLIIDHVFLNMVSALGLRLSIAREVRLVTVQDRAVEDGRAVLDNKAVHRMLNKDGKLGI